MRPTGAPLLLAAMIASLPAASFADMAMPQAAGGNWPPGLALSDPMPPVMDHQAFAHVLFNQLEGRVGATTALRWEGQGWIGSDTDRLWLKSEGFLRRDAQAHTEQVDDGRHELLYGRAISTYFDLQAGIRSDIDSHPLRNWAAFGVQGLAPFFVDLEATAYASGDGHFAGRIEAAYDLHLTEELILQPQAELNIYSKADRDRLVGAGFSDLDAGVRLRYEITRKFAPYIGVAYEGKFGETAALARVAGENANAVRFVFGVRSWF